MKEIEDFLAQATDPNQYDRDDLNWSLEGVADSPVRIYIWEHIKPLIGDLSDISVLDVGTGAAWMPLRMKEELNASNITALEPSHTQRELAKTINPGQPITPMDLMEFQTDETYNLITAVMVFEHIHPLEPAFRKLASLGKNHSNLLVVFGDKDTFLTPRADYQIEQQQIDDDTFAIQAVRTYGVLGDIVRSPQTLVNAAESSGFALTYHQPLIPNDYLRENVSRYSQWGDSPICHLMVFTKVESV